MPAGKTKSVVVGLGNPILSDDAVGIVVAQFVHQQLTCTPDVPERVDLIEAAVGGFELVEMIAGYDKAVIVDAIQTEGGRAGECYLLDLEQAASSDQPAMTHQVGLIEGLELARRLGMKTPGYLRVYAVEAADILTFSTELTPEVKAAVAGIARGVLADEFGVTPAPCPQAEDTPSAG